MQSDWIACRIAAHYIDQILFLADTTTRARSGFNTIGRTTTVPCGAYSVRRVFGTARRHDRVKSTVAIDVDGADAGGGDLRCAERVNNSTRTAVRDKAAYHAESPRDVRLIRDRLTIRAA